MVVNNANLNMNSSAPPEVPRACLICRPNSHPFNDRTLALDQAVKVGRSVARARATAGNAIFDCKVLSRNHALLWYEAGKFYLQDTKSSNGTFVNNQRLSKGSEESPPREVCSGDILQFGVDVMENSKKVTHGCIIATLKLFLPDGKEAKASPTIVNSTNSSALLSLSLPTQDLYQLNQYIQEALAREQLLETKLAVLQRLVGQTESASSDAWKSLIDEDRLLTRVEILESQLTTYGKSMNEDKLREETQRLMEEKEEYQERAKDTLKRLVNEKLEAVKKLQELEKSMSNTEDEYATLRELYENNIEDNKKLAAEVNRLSNELEAAKEKIPAESSQANEETVDDKKPGDGMEDVEPSAEGASSSSAQELTGDEPEFELSQASKSDILNASTNTLNMSSLSEDTDSHVSANEAVQEALKEKLTSIERQLTESHVKYEALKEENNAITLELNVAQQQLCEALKVLDEKCRVLEEFEAQKPEAGPPEKSSSNDDSSSEEMAKLMAEREQLCDENERLRAEVDSHQQIIEDYEQRLMAASTTSTLVGSTIAGNQKELEKSLVEAEAKINELLKVKEKYAEVSAEKSTLAMNLSEMQEEMNLMSLQSRTATACALVPVVVVVLAVLASYLPFFPNLFGGGNLN